MKNILRKKGLKITLIVIIAVFLLTVIVFSVILFSGNQLTVARCIVSDNGSLYMVYDDRPVHLTYDKDTDYQTGDKLLIVHASAFAESDPERTRTLFAMKISSGSKEDIPQTAFDILIETGNMAAD